MLMRSSFSFNYKNLNLALDVNMINLSLTKDLKGEGITAKSPFNVYLRRNEF
jgi:hypothetical protein